MDNIHKQPNLSDETLAKMAKEGAVSAFEELFEKYKEPMVNFLYRVIGNRETAEEVTQEVFIKVYRNLDIYDPERKFATWLFAIARNLAKNSLRDKKYFHDVSLEEPVSENGNIVKIKDTLVDPGVMPDVMAEDKELSEAVQNILNSMKLKYKEVVMLCCVMGLTEQEAAVILKCSAATVCLRLKKARQIFMKKVGLQ